MNDVVVTPLRVILVVAAGLVFLAGVQLFLAPLDTAEWFAWTVKAPMTAVFLGAAYWSSVVLELSGALSAHWGRARLTVWAVFVFTTLTLVVTLVHLDAFHLGAEQPTSARVVTWGWLVIYVGVPVAMLLGLVQQHRSRGGTDSSAASYAAGRPLAPALRLLVAGLALVLLAAGVALLLAPGWASGAWAWPLTDLTARAIGAWLVGLGWAAAHAYLIDDGPSVRPLGMTGITFVVLQAVALLRFGEALVWSSWQAVGYLALLVWIGLVSVGILLAGTPEVSNPPDGGGAPDRVRA